MAALDAPPLPRPQLMSQRWVDVAFLHWRVDPALLAPWTPPGVVPDLDPDGAAWVGLVPFTMSRAAVGTGPPVPWLGDFLETNVRTYGRDGEGRRGVVFRSLDCDRLAVVVGARAVLGLPYRWARLAAAQRTGPDGARELVWTARTRWPGPGGVRSRVHLREGAPVPHDARTTFLTARFGLHTAVPPRSGRTWWVPNEHEPWPLRSAEVLALDDGLLAAAGLPGVAQRPPDSVLLSRGVVTRFGRPVAVRA